MFFFFFFVGLTRLDSARAKILVAWLGSLKLKPKLIMAQLVLARAMKFYGLTRLGLVQFFKPSSSQALARLELARAEL